MGEFAAVVAFPQVGVGVQGHHGEIRVAGLHGLEQGHGDGVFAAQGADELALGDPGLDDALDFLDHGLGAGDLRQDGGGGGQADGGRRVPVMVFVPQLHLAGGGQDRLGASPGAGPIGGGGFIGNGQDNRFGFFDRQ